ncbi:MULTISPECIES: hypothetical protein [unclassified Streptomyces]|uniref:hypothetical protein n=1 Tax=unclassified Streptomyces TaxID=2593676 RepID=UPI002252CFEE|nr:MULTISPECIES: hypothetical protein [unclassified Streptomyces]MCX4625161.1 hypothetical protein [Streptomyces sp. NBC_01443]MCX4633526.1 hypothetical protein [Streptomyces sp. NBC_01443]
MPADLTALIAASARWLTTAYQPPTGALSRALAEAQARQATALAAALCYPTSMDVQLLHLLAPSGSHRLDWLTGCEPHPEDTDTAWRTWVDETVVSWAACLLAEPALATRAHQALAATEHHAETGSLQRLTHPSALDSEAAALLRHPDLLEGIAVLHRPQLLQRLNLHGAELP